MSFKYRRRWLYLVYRYIKNIIVSVLSVKYISPVNPATVLRPRLSLVDWSHYNYYEPAGPGTYAFGYDIEDPATNNVQFRNEERHPNGTVNGSYGYVEPDGNVRIVHYVADHNGYRATEENRMKLSMLKPIKLPETPFLTPEITPYSQGNYKVHDQSTRPLDRFNKRVLAHPQNLFVAHQIDSAPQRNLYGPNKFEAIHRPDYAGFVNPTRYYIPRFY